MNHCENLSDSNIACFFSGLKLFLSPEITGKVYSSFVILRECETGCIALVGKLGLTAKVQCLFTAHQQWHNKEFLPVRSWDKRQAKHTRMLYKTLTSAVFMYGRGRRPLSNKVVNMLRKFERRILKMMQIPMNDNGIRKPRYNNKSITFISRINSLNYTKLRGERLRCIKV